MSYLKLEKSLRDGIEANNLNKKEQGKLRQLLTALNNLSKNNLCNTENFTFMMTDGLDELLESYKAILKNQNKSDIRGALTRVRNLSKYYIELTEFNTESLTFSEIMKEGLRRKYGSLNVFYEGDLSPKDQAEIKRKYKTYREVCFEMLKVGLKTHPELWPRIDVANLDLTPTQINKKLDSAARNIRDWITGDTTPANHIPDGRLNFIESYLKLPNNCLLNKANLINKKSIVLKKTEAKTKAKVRTKPKGFKVKKLNNAFAAYFKEYSDYKIYGKQPEVKNVTQEMRDDKYALQRLKVRELQGTKEVRWTAGSNGIIGAAEKFHYSLRGFINYCVEKEGIGEDEVSLSHLTTPRILENLVVAAQQGFIGGSVVYDILSIVKVGAGKKGYLRLCGEPGDRTLDEYFNDLEFIIEESPIWRDSASKSKKTQGQGAEQGKENIQFLLKMDIDERKEVSKKAINKLIEKSKANLLEADRFILLSKSKKKKQSVKEKCYREAISAIKSAYHESAAAMIMHTAPVSCPRVINWATLTYFNSVTDRDLRVPSLTYHRHKNRFELNIPLFGPSPINGEEIRFIKNSDSTNAAKVNVMFPEYITATIKNFLKVREYYIEYCLTHEIPMMYKRNLETIEKLKNGAVKDLSEDANKKIISVLELDNKHYQKFDKDDVRPLFVWCAINKDLSSFSSKQIEGWLESSVWHSKREFGRKNFMMKTTIGSQFKLETRDAFYEVDPSLEQSGINIHGMRHLSAESHLDEYPGDFIGAAAIINDTVEMVIKTYGQRDRSKAMKRLGEKAE